MAILQSTSITGSAVISGSLETIGTAKFDIPGGDGGIRIGNDWGDYQTLNWISNNVGFTLGAGGSLIARVGATGPGGFIIGNITTNQGTSATLDVRGDTIITGSNNLSGNYALKVANSSGTDILAVENDGKVGIGTDNPGRTLSVNGDLSVGSRGFWQPDGSTQLHLGYGTSSSVKITTQRGTIRLIGNTNSDGSSGTNFFTLTSMRGSGAIFEAAGTDLMSDNLTLYYQISDPDLNYIGAIRRQASGWFATNDHRMIGIGDSDYYNASAGTVLWYTNNQTYHKGLLLSKTGNVGINTTSPTERLHVSGNLKLDGIVTGSLTIASSGSTVLDVQGSLGQLFSVNDSFSGSLFKVATISGMPVVEAFSDNTVKIGTFNNEAIVVSGSHTTLKDTEITGSAVISGSTELTGSFKMYSTGSGVPFILDFDQTGQGDAFQVNIANSNSNWRGISLNYTDNDGVTDPIGLRIGAYKPSNAMAFNAYNVGSFLFQGANLFSFGSELSPSSTYGIVSDFHQNVLFKLKSNNGGTYPITSYRFRSDSSSGTGQNISGEIMRIGGNGSVGIGTATDTSASLHIKGSNNLSDNYALKVTNNSDTEYLSIQNDGSFQIGATVKGIKNTSNQVTITHTNTQAFFGGEDIKLAANNTGKIWLQTDYVNHVVLSNDGNFGIGTTTPDAKLVITGPGQSTTALNTSANLGASLVLSDSNTSGAYGSGGSLIFGGTGSGGNLGRFAAIKGFLTNSGLNSVGDIAFSTRAITSDSTLTEQMRIVNTGNVGIGLEDPQTKLHVSGAVSASAFFGSVTDITPPNQTASLDCSTGNFFTLTLSSSADTLLTASNIQPGQSINLRITQPSTSGSLSYGPEFKFPNGLPYSVSATSSVEDILSFIAFDSTALYGSSLKNFQ